MALERIELPAPEDRAGKEVDWPEVRRILAKVDATPILDYRAAEEILGYNEHGRFS